MALPEWGDWAEVAPCSLSPDGLIDAVVAADRMLSRVHAVQAGLLAEMAKPGRAGDVGDLVEALVSHGGGATNVDGSVNVDALEDLLEAQAFRMAGAAVGVALRISPNAAQIRVNEAADLVGGLPATLAALRHGEIDRSKARLIADRTRMLEPDARRLVEGDVVGLATSRVPRQLRDLVDRAVIKVDPDAAAKRRRAARSGREVTHRPQPDGMGLVSAYLPAEGAVSLFTLVDLIAGRLRGTDARSVGELRADAVVDIANRLLTDGSVDLADLISAATTTDTAPGADPSTAAHEEADPVGHEEAGAAAHEEADPAAPATANAGKAGKSGRPGEVGAGVFGRGGGCSTCGHGSRAWLPHHQGRPVDLVITMSLSTFSALDDLPVHLAGHGAMTAEWGRTIAQAARSVTVLLLDPVTGTAVGAGQRVYRPRQRVRDTVIALSPTCSWPGCGQPAWKTDLDHIQPFDHRHPDRGGPTTVRNLAPHCRWHHLLKTHGHWATSRNDDGSITLTGPTGRQWVNHRFPFTLPGEWLQRIDSESHRGGVGLADAEHRQQLGYVLDYGPRPLSWIELVVHRHLAERRRQRRLHPDTTTSTTTDPGGPVRVPTPPATELPDDPPF